MAHQVESPELRDQAINIRVTQAQRDRIDRAARVLNKNRSEFILETVSREAEHVLLDQIFFRLNDDAYARFTALLDAPPAPTAALRDLLQRNAPWEQ